MDVDTLTQVFVVGDQGQGLVGDVVKLHALAVDVVLHTVIHPQKVFTSLANGDFGPWPILDSSELSGLDEWVAQPKEVWNPRQ